MATVPTKVLKVAGSFGSYGEDGATFTPSVSSGILSWSNNKGLPNPPGVYISVGVLIVTIDSDTGYASHTPSEILAHVEHGGSVYINDGNTLVTLCVCDDYAARFDNINAEEYAAYTIYVYEDGSVEHHSASFIGQSAYQNDMGNIKTALDNIIAIQESLVGGGSE